MALEIIFRQWWQDSYGMPPGKHAIMTHVAFAQHIADLINEEIIVLGNDDDDAISGDGPSRNGHGL